jgi:hypothetical protein
MPWGQAVAFGAGRSATRPFGRLGAGLKSTGPTATRTVRRHRRNRSQFPSV